LFESISMSNIILDGQFSLYLNQKDLLQFRKHMCFSVQVPIFIPFQSVEISSLETTVAPHVSEALSALSARSSSSSLPALLDCLCPRKRLEKPKSADPRRPAAPPSSISFSSSFPALLACTENLLEAAVIQLRTRFPPRRPLISPSSVRFAPTRGLGDREEGCWSLLNPRLTATNVNETTYHNNRVMLDMTGVRS